MEEVGFEPTVRVNGLLFSRQTHSATLPLFHMLEISYMSFEVINSSLSLSAGYFTDAIIKQPS